MILSSLHWGSLLLLLMPGEKGQVFYAGAHWGSALIPLALTLVLWFAFTELPLTVFPVSRRKSPGSRPSIPVIASWHRRHFACDGTADHPADPAGNPDCIQYQGARKSVHDPVPAAGNRHAGCIRQPGSAALLPLLGNRPGADVFPDQPVGRGKTELCFAEIHPVHHGRLTGTAACHPDDRRGDAVPLTWLPFSKPGRRSRMGPYLGCQLQRSKRLLSGHL